VPSLDLRFATDKTLTARRGPTPTFTRGSGATYIGSDGLIHGIDTSTTSNTIGTGSRTFTLAATAGQDQFWRTGDAVEASNGSNIMAGTVTSYDAATQSLVCNMTTASGTGTFTSWRIGYRGPRFDHDPVTLACKGLLIEEGRTNLFSSTNLNDWSASRVTRTAITGIGLTNQATTLTRSEIGSSYIFRGATLTTRVAYAISLRVKAGTAPTFSIADFTDSKFSRAFNLSTNQWAASGGSAEFTNYRVTPNIDGWFLVSAIYKPTGATGAKNIVFEFQGVVGDTVSFDTPQIEAGSFPTSYIPTTTGTLARGADVCNITGANFTSFYNQSEGTMLANSSCFAPQPTAVPSRRVVAATDGTIGNRVSISNVAVGYITPGLSQAFVVSAGGIGQSDIGIAGLTLSSLNKTAAAYKENDFALSTNSSAVVTDAIASVPTNLNRLDIGTQINDGFLCGHIAAIRYYKKRLPNAKLAQLTV
jgi:hypothetical protein